MGEACLLPLSTTFFSYISVVSFIDGQNRSTQKKMIFDSADWECAG